MAGDFKLTITAKMRHGLLWEARQKLGSNRKLAKYLGVNEILVRRWINLKAVPDLDKSPRLRKRWKRIEKKLLKLTGHLIDDFFPPELKSLDLMNLKTDVELTKEFPLERLIASGATPPMLASPDTEVEFGELKRAIRESLSSLYRHRPWQI